MPLPEPASRQIAVGEVLAVLAGADASQQLTGASQPEATTASRTAKAASRGH